MDKLESINPTFIINFAQKIEFAIQYLANS